MAEGKDSHNAEQETETGKRPPWWKRLWEWMEFGKKSGWDWLQLLVVPLVLAGLGVIFSLQQDARQQAIEEQRAQDIALQGYLDQIGTLMLEDMSDPKVQTLARARTLSVLKRLDSSRKEEVMRFLIEAELVRALSEGEVIIPLAGANLSDTDLSGANLRYAILIGANLRGADLRRADLSHANLSDANLIGANLRYTLASDANLIDANLRGADLSYANLSGTDLSYASGVSTERLEQQALSLEGATMPNGQKYEDWLKSKGSGEDAENP